MIIEPHTHQYNWSWARIDVYLSQYCGMSRNFVQHCINHWLITISDQAIKKSYHLQDGDLICIWSLARFQDVGVLAECAWIPLEIKLQTPDYVVLIKPKWVLSHPTSIREVGQPSVVWFLAHHFSNIPSVGSIIRAGLIQRLDKMTDGLMICILSERWLKYFGQLFREKSQASSIAEKELVRLRKYYHAKSHLTPLWAHNIAHIDRYPYYIQSIVKSKVPSLRSYKMGITKILSLDQSKQYVHTNLEILTGRTHQIRYHLSQMWLPIVGDSLYGVDDDESLWLTAYQLDFVDPDGYDRVVSLEH